MEEEFVCDESPEAHQKFECEHCGKELASSKGLKLHIQAKHTTNKPWKCSIKDCKSSFVEESRLRFHKQRTHKQLGYNCESCGKQFKYKNEKIQHEHQCLL